MGSKTDIAWCDATWSPLRARVKPDAAAIARQKGYTSLIQIADRMAGHVGPHCEPVSDGCKLCYSGTNNARCLPANGTGLPFDRRSRDLVDMFIDEKILEWPLRWRKPRKIFVESQSDLFGEFAPDQLIDQAFAIMALCPQHTFQVLTKRADRMFEYISARPESMEIYRLAMGTHILTGRKGRFGERHRFPLPNVWLGVSVEDQTNADNRIPYLLRTPAAKKFISYEPALGPLNLQNHPMFWSGNSKLDWVIAGCESGSGARPMKMDWTRSIRDQCQDSGAAFFLKQAKVNGKVVSTPELDGRTWTEFPEVRNAKP